MFLILLKVNYTFALLILKKVLIQFGMMACFINNCSNMTLRAISMTLLTNSIQRLNAVLSMAIKEYNVWCMLRVLDKDAFFLICF